MTIKGDLHEWGVDLYALQHLTTVPPDDPNGALYIDGEPYPPEGGGGGSDYVHPDHTGDVASVADGAQTIQPGVVTNAKLASMASGTFKGNNGADGPPVDLTPAEARTLLNVADGAQVNTVVSVNTKTGAAVLDSDDISDTGKTHKFATAAQLAKVDHLAVTQAVNLDTLETDVATNNAKVTNATHTGEVTGSGALTVDKTAITNRTAVTPAGADHALIYDASGAVIAKALVSLWPLTRLVATVTDGATVTIDSSTAYNGVFKLTMAGNRTIAAPTGSPIDGQTMEVWFIQDATGSRVPTFNSAFKFNGVGGAITMTTTANAVDILCFQYYATTAVWMCTAKVLAAAI